VPRLAAAIDGLVGGVMISNPGVSVELYPRDMDVLGPQIKAADRIVFYTYRNVLAHPTTAAEMALIQSDAALRAKTIFVIGGLAEP
jgi:hypothetical protein